MTTIFAHRGFAAKYSENTMTAFRQAEKNGAEGLELDVQLTKDGIPVIIHDEKVGRTTGGTGYVKDYTYKELRKLNADFKKSSRTGTEHIPSLQELLEWLKGTQLSCNIELKNGVFAYTGMEEKVINLIRDFNLEERIIISSFNHYSLVHCAKVAPDLETAPLFSDQIFMPWVYAEAIGSKGIHPKFRYATDDVIKNSIERGIAVRPYTVNKESVMTRLFNSNCTALITDNPALAAEIRINMKKRP